MAPRKSKSVSSAKVRRLAARFFESEGSESIEQQASRIRAYWRSNKAPVEQWLARNGIKAGPTLFVNSTKFSAAQARMLRDLDIP